MYKIIDYLEKFDIDLEKLISKIYSEKTLYNKFGYKERPFLQTKILFKNNEMKGFLSIWKSDLHTNSLYLNITLNSSLDFNKEFKILFEEALKIQNKFKLKFQTGYDISKSEYLKNFELLGFSEKMRTYDFVCPIDSMKISEDFEISEYKILKSSQISTEDKKIISQSRKYYYHQTHPHNLPSGMNEEFWIENTFGEGIIDDYSFVFYKNEDLIGFISFEEGFVNGNIYLAQILWIANLSKNEKLNILKYCFSYVIQNKKFKGIEFEVDDKSPNFMEMLDLLQINFDKKNYFLTLQKGLSARL